jgi:membrane fusion protein, multidrug efflux system
MEEKGNMPNVENSKQESTQEGAPAPKGKSRVRVILLLVVLCGAIAAYANYLRVKDQVSSDDAQVDGHIAAVAPKIAGNVLEVLVKDNQEVKAGDPLVRIDPRDYEARVNIAKAELVRAESLLNAARVVVPWTRETTNSNATAAGAQLGDAQAELERARLSAEQAAGSDLAYAEANVSVRQANSDRARADLARMKPLADKAEISQLQYDAYVAAARVAENDLKAAQERLASAKQDASIRKASLEAVKSRVAAANAQLSSSLANRKQVDIRNADAGTAAAAVETARANLAAAELQLSYAAIVSPVDGVVTRKTVEVGQVISPGQGLMTIVPLHNTWITANFKETQLAEVKVGQRAEVHVDMYGKSIAGRVDSISSATGARMALLPPENATGNFVKVVQRIPVKILVDARDGLTLRPGMNADVTIFTK